MRIFLLFITLFSTCFASTKTAPKVVEVFVVKPTSIVKKSHIIGEIKANKFSNIYAKIDGKIDLIETVENNTITKGQILAVLENDLLSSQVELAKKTEGLAKSKFERLSKLDQLESISKDLLDQSKDAWLKAKIELNDKQISLDKTIIKAPFTGRLSHFQVTEGAMIKSGELLAVAYDISSYTIELLVSPSLLKSVRKGQKIVINKKYPGKIHSIQESLCKDNKMGLVYAKLANCDGCFIGQIVETAIITDSKKQILAVPNNTIYFHKGSEHVVKIIDGKTIVTKVAIGINNSQFTEITSGLHEGDLIVKSNPARLNNDESVIIHESS